MPLYRVYDQSGQWIGDLPKVVDSEQEALELAKSTLGPDAFKVEEITVPQVDRATR
jgi:hypothetical protein